MIIAQVVGPARSSCAEVKREERNSLIDVFSEGPLVFFLGKKNPSQSLHYLLLCGRHLVGNSVIISGLPAPTSRGSLSITPPPCVLRLPSCRNICKILFFCILIFKFWVLPFNSLESVHRQCYLSIYLRWSGSLRLWLRQILDVTLAFDFAVTGVLHNIYFELYHFENPRLIDS